MTRSAPPHIRRARLDDADDLYALHVAVVRDGRGVVRDTPWSRELVIDRLRRFVEGARGATALLVAEHDHRVIGAVDLQQMGPPFLRHVVTLGLEVHPEHQRRGVGRALMEAAMAWAGEAGLRRIELYVRADNDRALALYRSLGFVLEGTRRHCVQLPDGTFIDDHVLGLLLDR